MPFRISRLSAGAAISVVAACALVAKASAQVPASLLIGPDRVGSAVTYRITTTDGRAGSAPNVQTLALRWKLGQKVVVTLTSADGTQAMPFVATRADDGTLTLDNMSAGVPEGQRLAMAIGVLNRLDGVFAAAPAGATTWKTSLVVQPPAPPAPDPQSTQVPQPLKIPVAATRSDDTTGITLAASGSVDRTLARPAGGGGGGGGGGGRRGGGMGGGGMGGGGMGGGGMGGGGMGGGGMGGGSGSARKNIKVTTKITVDAHFGRDGELTLGTIVETNQAADDQNQQDGQSQPNPPSQPSARSWKIERTQ